jgi:hypothetical protein
VLLPTDDDWFAIPALKIGDDYCFRIYACYASNGRVAASHTRQIQCQLWNLQFYEDIFIIARRFGVDREIYESFVMAPISSFLLKARLSSTALLTAGSAAVLHRRNLDVNGTQKVTLGIIAVYVVVIAILWNIPYVRNVLWPFKVRFPPTNVYYQADQIDVGYCIPRIRTRNYGMLYRRKSRIHFP